ncbi:MAG TPA: peptidylprolyl isomerase [Candidatus Dormibacteraeota bacterium]|nr:peptidylprolyl isomerase [Candidatus Dormibacteraeota bacterium]
MKESMEFIRYLALAGMCLAGLPAIAQEKPVPQEQPKMEKPQMAPEAEAEKGPDKSKTADKDKVKAAAVKPRVASSEGKVVEEIIARVNNEIITRSELDKGRKAAEEEATQECNGRCTPEQLQVVIEDRKKNALRDLIDQSLLVQRGKDMGISVESDVVKKLDAIRIQNKMASMEELEKAVSSQGMNWEDFKSNIRNSSLTQAVIGREVGSHLSVGHEEVAKYYDEHKSEFLRPEQVALRAIEVVTQGKKEDEIPALKKKAETALKRVQDGEDFGEIAKRFSDGSTAKQGGYLGTYKRGELAKELENKVFAMKKNELTEIMDTKQGFLIMQVLEHYDEGEQPLAKVETEIMDRLYGQRMEPAYREYLKTLREQSYVVIKPGYQDIAGGGNSEIQEVSATPEVTKDRKPRKKYILFGKKS